MRSIVTDGLHRTNLESVAARLDVFRSQVVYYFKSGDELLLSLLAHISFTAQSMLAEDMGAAATPPEKLIALIRSTFRWAREEPSQVKVRFALFNLYTSAPKFKKRHSEIYSTAVERIEVLLKEMGVKDARPVSEGIVAIFTGRLMYHFSTNAQGGLDRIEEDTLLLSNALVRGRLNAWVPTRCAWVAQA